MSNEIEKHGTGEKMPVAATPMDLLQAAVASNVDADQLGKLMDLQERYQANEARRAFSNAMADFQARCPTVLKTKRADRYNYAPLDEILRTIRPHLEATGLSIRFSTKTEGPIITATCTVTHREGHSEVSEFSAPIDPNMKVNETQKTGSANSYAKRYCVCNALNLVASDEEDDDGYGAGTAMITDKQIIELQDYIDSLDVDVPGFLNYIGADEIKNIPAAKWPAAMKAIDLKRAKNESS